MDKLSKKKGGWIPNELVLGLVVAVNSRVVLEGKKKVKKRSLSALDFVGDRGDDSRQIV
jgi:hypothetical protein